MLVLQASCSRWSKVMQVDGPIGLEWETVLLRRSQLGVQTPHRFSLMLPEFWANPATRKSVPTRPFATLAKTLVFRENPSQSKHLT